MTLEERQLRAWVRTLFRHVALRWVARERQGWGSSLERDEEAIRWQHDEELPRCIPPDYEEGLLWLTDCLPRLTPRQHGVVTALYHGMTAVAIARQQHCSPRTIRRIVVRIRQQCPR